MTIEEDVFEYIDMHPRCNRMEIQGGLGLTLGEVNGCIFALGNRVRLVDRFELPSRFVVNK